MKEQLKKILKGAAIAAVGAGLTVLAQSLSGTGVGRFLCCLKATVSATGN